MTRQSVHSPAGAVRPLVLLLGVALATAAAAQPSNNSPNQFGDRQSGQWGDPGQGYFGNPSVGDFDKSQIKAPPPGTKPLGKVYNGKAPETPPYVTLPAPVDAADAAPAPAKPTKKPAKKRASKKTAEKTAG